MPKLGALSLALGACVFASQAAAQDAGSQFLIPAPGAAGGPAAGGPSGFFRGAPGTSTGTPSAFAPGFGDFFAGFGYEASTRGIKRPDGTFTKNDLDDASASVGFGIGDANDFVGLETVASMFSGTVRRGSFNRTSFSFQLSRNIAPHAAIAVGVEDASIVGGSSTDDSRKSVYGVASYVWINSGESRGLPKAVTISGGVGNGRFRLYDDWAKDRSTVNVFGSASLLFHQQVSGIVDWTGQDLNAGLSLVPFKNFPITITPAVVDITGLASQSARFVVSAGLGFHYDFGN